MCIIVYKPIDTQLPDEEILKECFSSNPHGAGFMYRDQNASKIQIKKGFMTFKALESALSALSDISSLDLVIHFRYATHGSQKPGNCHPFPIDPSVKALRKLSIVSERGMVHNGINSLFSGIKNRADLSDSAMLAKYISRLGITDPLIKSALSDHGKYILMDSDNTQMIGLFISDNGCYYSNDSYKPIISYKRCVGYADGYDTGIQWSCAHEDECIESEVCWYRPEDKDAWYDCDHIWTVIDEQERKEEETEAIWNDIKGNKL